MQKARELNIELEQLFKKADRKPITESKDVVGIIILRYDRNGDIDVTCLGRVSFRTGAVALLETEHTIDMGESKERMPIA